MGNVRLTQPMVTLLRDLWQHPSARLRQRSDHQWVLYGLPEDQSYEIHNDLVTQASALRWVAPSSERNGLTITTDGITRLLGASASMRFLYGNHFVALHEKGAERYGQSWLAANQAVLNIARRYGLDANRVHNRLPDHALKCMLSEMAMVVCETLLKGVKAWEDQVALGTEATRLVASALNSGELESPSWARDAKKLLRKQGYTETEDEYWNAKEED